MSPTLVLHKAKGARYRVPAGSESAAGVALNKNEDVLALELVADMGNKHGSTYYCPGKKAALTLVPGETLERIVAPATGAVRWEFPAAAYNKFKPRVGPGIPYNFDVPYDKGVASSVRSEAEWLALPEWSPSAP